MIKIFGLFFCSLITVFECSAFEFEKEKVSILIPFSSYHENNDIRHAVNQINPGIGIRYQLSSNHYVQVVRVFENSMDGIADSVGVGYDYYSFEYLNTKTKLGIELNAVKYEDRRGGIVYRTIMPSFTTSHEYKNLTLLMNIMPLRNNSVILFTFKIPLL